MTARIETSPTVLERQQAAPRRPVVLVTGTSSGIGLEIVKLLHGDVKYRILATARKASLHKLREAGLQESDRFHIRALEVTSDAERRSVLEEVMADWDGVDVIINNAGISYRAVVEHMNETEEHHQMETNFFGAMALIRLALPKMRERRYGRIINVSSVGGMMAMPTMSSYSASKFALEGASESLWYELRPWNIHVTLVQPGFIHSDSFRKVYYSSEARAASVNPAQPYFAYYKSMAPFVEKLMLRSSANAGDVARKIVKLLDQPCPPLRYPATLDARLFYWLRRWLPRRLYHRVLYKLLPGIRSWGR